MLKTLRLHNFRTYLNAEIDFHQRQLVIGSNNSGKTNLCAALQFLGATASMELARAAQFVPGGISELTNWALDSRTAQLTCVCALPFDGETLRYTYSLDLTVEASGGGSDQGRVVPRVAREHLVADGPGFDDRVLLENDAREAKMLDEESPDGYTAQTLAFDNATMLSKLYELETNRRAVSFRRYLSSWQYYALSPERMRYGWRTWSSGAMTLASHGDNLAMVLFQLKNLDEGRYRRVIEHVRLIEPDLEAINFIPAPDQGAVPLVALRGQQRTSWVGLSDGTLRSLALAFIAEVSSGLPRSGVPAAHPVVIIEEPENGIYPGQLRALHDHFEENASEGQFVFTSHSPYFINFFDGSRDCVTLLRRNKERTEIVAVPPAEDDPDRPPLAEQYSMELFG